MATTPFKAAQREPGFLLSFKSTYPSCAAHLADGLEEAEEDGGVEAVGQGAGAHAAEEGPQALALLWGARGRRQGGVSSEQMGRQLGERGAHTGPACGSLLSSLTRHSPALQALPWATTRSAHLHDGGCRGEDGGAGRRAAHHHLHGQKPAQHGRARQGDVSGPRSCGGSWEVTHKHAGRWSTFQKEASVSSPSSPRPAGWWPPPLLRPPHHP